MEVFRLSLQTHSQCFVPISCQGCEGVLFYSITFCVRFGKKKRALLQYILQEEQSGQYKKAQPQPLHHQLNERQFRNVVMQNTESCWFFGASLLLYILQSVQHIHVLPSVPHPKNRFFFQSFTTIKGCQDFFGYMRGLNMPLLSFTVHTTVTTQNWHIQCKVFIIRFTFPLNFLVTHFDLNFMQCSEKRIVAKNGWYRVQTKKASNLLK